MTLYAYTDETEFKRSESDLETIVGTGILITNKEIDRSFVFEAMDGLRADVEKDSRDLETLKRNYFHASEDSKNGHSYICKAINENISGSFRYSFYERKNQKTWKKFKSTENLNRLTLGLSSLEFFESNIDKVILTVENRNGFEQTAAENWINHWYKQLDLATYKHPSFLTYYPDLEIKISNKLCPGIQATDFILWTLNRANKSKPDETWKKRLNLKLYSEYYEEKGTQSGGTYRLNSFSIDYGRLNYPFKVNDPETNDELFQSYLTIEQTVRHISKIDLPEHVRHLEPMLSIIRNLFDNDKHLSYEKLSLMSSIFIRFFDTLPIYEALDDIDELKWSLILKAKKMAGLFLRNDLIHGVRSSDAILRWRNEMLGNERK
jgi:hypothetical protein